MEPSCRVCMSSSVTLVGLFVKQKQSKDVHSLADMIRECVDCEIHQDDPLPNSICLTCVIDAKNAFRFKRKCESSYHQFWRKLNIKKKELDVESEDIMDSPEWNIEEVNCLEPEIVAIDNWKDPLQGNLQPKLENDLYIPEFVDTCDTRSLSPLDFKESDKLEEELKISNNDVKPCSDEKPFLCDTCGMEFLDLAMVTAHLRVHKTEGRKFRCPHCSIGFNQRSNLKAHIRIHTGERPYKCDVCSETFILSHHLRDHMLDHTGELPYKCPYCPKACKKKSNLQTHLLVHSDSRPYKCPDCPAAFNHPSNLQQHRRIHSGNRPCQCPHCPKAFRRQQHLNDHIGMHTGERPYHCEKCQRDFRSRPGLKNHICQSEEDLKDKPPKRKYKARSKKSS